MAGTLTISTLSDGTNSTSSTNCIKGSAKAWVNFNDNGSTATINASYNVSSITYGGSGIYTVNFTASMPSSSYASALQFQTSSASSTYYGYETWVSSQSASNIVCRYTSHNTGGTQQQNTTNGSVTIFSN